MPGLEDKEDMEGRDKETELLLRTFMTPAEVAAFLRVRKKTVYRWFKLGVVTGIKIRRTIRITRRSVIGLLKNPGCEK